MVPDKPPSKYSTKVKQYKKEDKKGKSSNRSKLNAHHDSKFSFANARSSLGLVNQSMNQDFDNYNSGV